MKYYYCPNCNKQVGAQMNNTQIAIAVLLCIIFSGAACLPGIIYIAACTRRCPICGMPVEKLSLKKRKSKRGSK